MDNNKADQWEKPKHIETPRSGFAGEIDKTSGEVFKILTRHGAMYLGNGKWTKPYINK